MNEYTYDNISIGQTEQFDVNLSHEELNAFRKLTGDINPLHNNDAYAAELGYNGLVVFGMLTASYLSTLAGVYLPGKYSLIHEVNVSFVKPLILHSENSVTKLIVKGIVIEKHDIYKLLEVKVSILGKDGTKYLRGRMKIGVTK